MKRLLGLLTLKLIGWTIDGEFPKEVKKGLLVVAPHTSNWDFPLGVITRAVQGFQSNFVIKDTWLKLPIIGWFLKSIGGVGVDRSKTKKVSATQQIIDLFKQREKFVITITPEGTRSYNPNWKTGFWHISHEAKVPLILASFDYPTKRIIWEEVFYVSDDVEQDILRLKRTLGKYKGKFPENGIREEEFA